MTHRLRSCAASAAITTAYVVVGGALLPMTRALITSATGPDVQLGQLVGLAAAITCWVTLVWAALVTLLPLLAAAVAGTGSDLFRQVSALGPPSARHLVAALLGAGLLSGAIGAAVPAAAAQVAQVYQLAQLAQVAQVDHATRAAPTAPAHHAVRPVITATSPRRSNLPDLDRPARAASVASGWTPDRPAAPHRQSVARIQATRLVTGTPTPGRDVLDHLVVRRGDSLWEIAARHLGPNASAAEIAREWPRWHHANRSVIGPDPGLLLPGQQLVAPRAR